MENTVTINLSEYLELKEFKKNILANKTIKFGPYGRISIYSDQKDFKESVENEIKYIESKWKKETKLKLQKETESLTDLNDEYYDKIQSQKKQIDSQKKQIENQKKQIENQKKQIESLDLKYIPLLKIIKTKFF